MAESWTCPACATVNDYYRYSCATCGRSRPVGPPGEQDLGPGAGLSSAAGSGTADPALPPHDTSAGGTLPPEQAPTGRPLWRRIPPGIAIFAILAIIGAAASWYFNAGRSDSGEISRSGDLHASELQVGDCFDLKDPTADDVEDVDAKVCSEEHEFEVFLVGTLAEGDFPGDEAFDAFVQTDCIDGFEEYIGKDYFESELDIFYFTPTPDAWSGGDRTIQCAAYHPLESRLTGSLKASNR